MRILSLVLGRLPGMLVRRADALGSQIVFRNYPFSFPSLYSFLTSWSYSAFLWASFGEKVKKVELEWLFPFSLYVLHA